MKEDIEYYLLERKITSLGVEVIRLDMQGIDMTTPEGKRARRLKIVDSEYENSRNQIRFNNGKKDKINKGLRPFSKIPLGYIRTRISKKYYADEIDEVR